MPTIEKIRKRNGQIVDFDPSKITLAVEKAFEAVKGEKLASEAKSVTDQVIRYLEMQKGDAAPAVEQVQDIVERALMERGFFDVAKTYIIYRYEHAKIREERQEEIVHQIEEQRLMIVKRSGEREAFDPMKLRERLAHVARGYEDSVDLDALVQQCQLELYEGITTKDLREVLIMVVRSFIERDPAYSHMAGRLLMDNVYREALGYGMSYAQFNEQYRSAFAENIRRGIALGRLDKRLMDFDLDALAQKLKIERDDYFRYLGIQTLYTNYFVKDQRSGQCLETPQMFWMRIAMGAALVEKTPEERTRWAEEFYDIMSEFLYTPSSPTLYHSGTIRPQLSSCFLMTVPDDLHAIFKNYADHAQLSKYAGGVAVDWTYLRGTGAYIAGTGVSSQGVIPFLKIANDVTAAINRSGRRRGATCVYLETWHYDYPDFTELRRNTGDERRRTHDMNTASWIPDLFMKRVMDGGEWTLFSPDETPDLHDLYGKAFETRYEEYERMAAQGEIKLFRTMKAQDLWRKMLTHLFESGHPWMTFKDPSNIRSPQDHYGVVHSSNLCTEITLTTNEQETAVCNLGSLNFAKFVSDGRFDNELVAKVVPSAMRMLDNVIDINFYPTEDTERSNMLHRPVGLGIRGLQDALYMLGLPFDSDEAVEFSDASMEVVAYHALLASSKLAKQRGCYETYEGSKWSRGILPQDTIDLLAQERGMEVDVPRSQRLDWSVVREHISKHGIRNSNTMAIAPTATTANIVGCYPSIEPIYKNLYVKSNMAGDFMVLNEYLVSELKARGLWSRDMLDRIKRADGKIQHIPEVPEDIRARYKEVFDIDPRWLIRAAAYRGRWIDQSQSLNIFFAGTSGRELSDVYIYAWRLGLKTTYYLRSLGASTVEKSTVNLQKGDSVQRKQPQEKEGQSSPAASPQPEAQPSPISTSPQPVAAAASVSEQAAAAPSSEAAEARGMRDPQHQPTVRDVFVAAGGICTACEG